MDNAQREPLSARQAEIAAMVAKGKSNREIADALRLSPRTVDSHLAAIFNKLGVGSRVELVAALLRPRPPEPGHPAVAPLRSVVAIPNNLPRKLTSFIGREAEIAAITSLLGSYQLVTLVGSGGVGKTRTSLAVAEEVLGAFVDGVWVIELAPLSRGDCIPATVAQALGHALAADGDPVTNLMRVLKSKQLLLVFDNCEHLIADVAKVAALVLNDCHKIKILATSREPLRVRGEAIYRVPSLPVPRAAASTPTGVAEARASVAVALFVERAQAVDHRFTLTDDNAPDVADICRRLDGIPLALELAAVRVKVLSPRQLRDRLDERFRVLTGGNRDLPRQQTLRALIDWSHDLLDERERVLFRRLGIFVNGFTLEGALAVGSGVDTGELGVFDDLASLVDQSLVIAEPAGAFLRYRLLESTRAYALEKLDAAAEQDLLADRHLKYLRERFATLRSQAEQTARVADLEDALLREFEDVRAALAGAMSRRDVVTGAELLAEIGVIWRFVGAHGAGVEHLKSYLAALPETELTLLAHLSSALSALLDNLGLHGRALELAEQAVAYARKSGGGAVLAFALIACTFPKLRLGRVDEVRAELGEAEAIAQSTPLIRLRLLHLRALFYRWCGDSDGALRCHEHLRRQYRAVGDVGGELLNANTLAELEHSRGNTQRAITLAREALATLKLHNDSRTLATLLTNLAGYLCAIVELQDAEKAARDALIHLFADSYTVESEVAKAIEHLALAHALRGNLSLAAVLAGYADHALQQLGTQREFTEQVTRDRLTGILADQLAAGELEQLTTDGSALTPEAARELALGET